MTRKLHLLAVGAFVAFMCHPAIAAPPSSVAQVATKLIDIQPLSTNTAASMHIVLQYIDDVAMQKGLVISKHEDAAGMRSPAHADIAMAAHLCSYMKSATTCVHKTGGRAFGAYDSYRMRNV